MVSITDGPNKYGVYDLVALSTDTLPTTFPFKASNGTINSLGDGSTVFFKDTQDLKSYDEESNTWM